MSIIKNLLSAAYPCICITSQEPERVSKSIRTDGWKFCEWDCISGITLDGALINDDTNPVNALAWLNGRKDTVLIAHNLHLFLDIPEVVQAIETGASIWKGYGSALVMLSPAFPSKPEIDKLFHVIEHPLPSVNELFKMQENLVNGIEITGADGKPIYPKPSIEIARAARGLTEFEAEAAFSLCLSMHGRFDLKTITDVKGQMIRKSGTMEFWEPTDISMVGGLDRYKSFINNRAEALRPGSNLPAPKGIILVGVPGTGKSLASKATAFMLKRPLIRLDIGALKGSLVGESEKKMREALRIIDAFGEGVLWVDEIEKGFAGVQSSGQSDGGTSASMFGTWLTWMQETTSPILTIVTANDISLLPPEFMRAGRFDAIFFVDLPTFTERREIIEIMNKKWGSSIGLEMAEDLDGYTGAEIEQIAKDSLFDGVLEAFKSVVPLSKTMKEKIVALQEWAKSRARLVNTPEEEQTAVRKIKSVRPISPLDTREPIPYA